MTHDLQAETGEELTEDGLPPERVLVVEDQQLLGQLMVQQLRKEDIAADLAPLDSLDHILTIAQQTAYTVVLLDLDLGDDLGDSIPLIAPLRDTGARVAMLTGITDRSRHAECVEAGAVGVILKNRRFDELMADLREVVARGSLLQPGERDALLAQLREQRHDREQDLAPFQRLTRREQQVLTALMEGLSAQAIAQSWVVSYETVRTQIRSVLAKLGVHSQLEAVATAQQAGWPGLNTETPVSA